MVYSLLPVPFADAARQQLFEAVLAALRAEADAPATVLLGNLGAFTTSEADALLVRPTGVALLVLTPRGGRLTIPALAYGTWQLDGQPLPGRAGADNPFEQCQQQQPAALAWLSEQLGQALPPGQGLALFAGPLTFGPEVEGRLQQNTTALDFQLVGSAAQLPTRLQAWAAARPVLTEPLLRAWTEQLAATFSNDFNLTNLPAVNYLEQKLRQLWRWLGAEDIPADPPYGSPSPAPQPDQQEQLRLQQLRQELQSELQQYRQEAAAREASRTQELTQLRQQLAQAGQPAAEQQAQAALEEAVRTARAELAARNHELDARIRQLGQLIQQMQASASFPARPIPAAQKPYPTGALSQQAVGPLSRPAGAPTKAARPLLKLASYRPLRQAERWAVLGLALTLAGGGVWGVVRLVKSPVSQVRPAAPHRAAVGLADPENPQPAPVIIYDTLANDGLHRAAAADANLTLDTPTPETLPAATSPAARLHPDSVGLEIKPVPPLPSDSAASEASPAP